MAYRPITRLVACALVLAAAVADAQTPTPAPPALAASSYLLVDFHSGQVLAERDPDLRVEPASITKLMTSFVVFHEIEAGRLGLEDEVLISENAWRTGGSRMFVEVGKRVRVEDLLKGVIIQSGNDASVALAEHVAGSETVFAGLMNEHAARLGMVNTHYTNSTGLPDEALYTTAADVARLAGALIREFPQFYVWYSEREFTFNEIRQHNRNRLLWRDPSVDGLKTGHTSSAGYCLVTSAMRDGMRLISVVMGTDSENARAAASQALLNYGFRFFETFSLYPAGAELGRAKVWKGSVGEVRFGVERELFVTIPRGRQDRLTAELALTPRPIAPLALGEELGELRVQLDDELVLRHPLTVLEAVSEAGFFGRSLDGMRLWFGGLFGGKDSD